MWLYDIVKLWPVLFWANAKREQSTSYRSKRLERIYHVMSCRVDCRPSHW